MKKLNIKKRWQLEADCDSLLLVVTEEYLLTFSKPRVAKRAAKKEVMRFKTYPRRTPSTGAWLRPFTRVFVVGDSFTRTTKKDGEGKNKIILITHL